jgi:hypothetical protein
MDVRFAALVILLSSGCALSMVHRTVQRGSSKAISDPIKLARGVLAEYSCDEGESIFPDDDDCSLFWECEYVPYLVSCPDGQYYDKTEKSCYPSELVDCGSRSTPVATETEEIRALPVTQSYATKECKVPYYDYYGEDTFDETIPNPDDCSSYYQCEYIPYIYECPDGQYFSTDVNECYPSEEVDCGTRPTGVTTVSTTTTAILCTTAGDVLADPDDCSSFYLCNTDLTPLQYFCPTGEGFDASIGACSSSIDCDV